MQKETIAIVQHIEYGLNLRYAQMTANVMDREPVIVLAIFALVLQQLGLNQKWMEVLVPQVLFMQQQQAMLN
jgi:hypothetical protein